MTRNGKDNGRVWTLSLVRDYSPTAKKIEVATFYFGRDLDELVPRPSSMGRLLALSKEEPSEDGDRNREVRKLPTGLISLLGSAGLTDNALEAGFLVEMTRSKPGHEASWVRFVKLAEGVARERSVFGGMGRCTRVAYIESGTTNSMEFVPLDPHEPMLPSIWVRVIELPDEMLAGVIAEEILSQSGGCQTTLDEFMDLEFETLQSRARVLVLPGPAPRGCC